jgi:hypothetical protein
MRKKYKKKHNFYLKLLIFILTIKSYQVLKKKFLYRHSANRKRHRKEPKLFWHNSNLKLAKVLVTKQP